MGISIFTINLKYISIFIFIVILTVFLFIDYSIYLDYYFPGFLKSDSFRSRNLELADVNTNTERGRFLSMYTTSGYVKGIFSNEWVPMTQSEALHYYTAHEICGLTHRSSTDQTTGCQDEPGNIDDCNVYGAGYFHSNRPCSNYEGSFLRHRSTKPWPHSRNIVDLIKVMTRKGSNTVIFIGDSLSEQHLSDALCTSRRFGLKTNIYKYHKYYEGIFGGFEVINPNEKRKYPPYFQFLSMLFTDDEHFRDAKMEADIDKLITNSSVISGKILFIINCGLHYNEPNKLNNTLWKFIPLMVKYASLNHTVIFRETSAQHFQTVDGGYMYPTEEEKQRETIPKISAVSLIANRSRLFDNNSPSLLSPLEIHNKDITQYDSKVIMNPNTFPQLDYRCARIKNMTMLKRQNWRNDMALSILKDVDKNNQIGISRFYIMTAARYDYHVASYGDCTHYCFGPMIWAPVWDFIINFYIKSTISQ